MARRTATAAVGRWERGLVIALCGMTPLAVWPWAYDALELAKWTLICLVAAALGAAWLARIILTREVVVSLRADAVVAAAFVVAAGIATATSPSVLLSIFGEYARYGGFMLYAAVATVFFAVRRAFDANTVAAIAWALALSAIGVSLAALGQQAGIDPWFSQSTYGGSVYGTLGNPNFASAFLGCSLPLLCWAAVANRRKAMWSRVIAAVGALLCIAAMVATGSAQGFVAAGAGVFVFAAAVVFQRTGLRQQPAATLALASLAVVGFAATAAGVFGRGPLALLGAAGSVQLRRVYAEAAYRMFTSDPLTGIGLDRYIAFFREFRPEEGVRLLAVDVSSNAAHNVPLHFFAGGGLLLGLAHIAFVIVVGVALVRGFRSAAKADMLLLGALGGSWVGYMAQSLVSIDVPTLALLHWVLAGTIVVLSPYRPLLGHTVPVVAGGGSSSRSLTRRKQWAVGVCGVIVVASVVVGTVPLRADMHASRGHLATSQGDSAAAATHFGRAVALAPWVSDYRYRYGRELAASGEVEAALATFERGAKDGDLPSALGAAETAAALGQHDVAEAWYTKALQIEPQHPEMFVIVGKYFLERGDHARAQALAERALEIAPDNEEAAQLAAESSQ